MNALQSNRAKISSATATQNPTQPIMVRLTADSVNTPESRAAAAAVAAFCAQQKANQEQVANQK